MTDLSSVVRIRDFHSRIRLACYTISAACPVRSAAGLNAFLRNASSIICKAFNADTQDLEPGLPIPVVITVYADKSFSYIKKTPPAAVLLKRAAGVEKGSGEPHKEKVGKVDRGQLEEIARAKMPDLSAFDIDQAVRIIAGSARSMGIETEGV